ncbi:MAG: hypothetical protein MUF79_01305 [Burkholderiales bacterium]|jgi:hypothetical protein|nr:hypothetical protein [Burkholderiales bacterium]
MISRLARLVVSVALSSAAGAALAQYPGPGVPMVPMAPGTPAPAPQGLPGALSEGLGKPSGESQVLIAPDGSSTVRGVAVPVEVMNRLNSLVSGRTFGASSPLGGRVDARINDLTPEAFANPGDKLANPTPGIPSTDQSTWYPNVQVPGMTSLNSGAAVGGSTNVLTVPAGTPVPGIPEPSALRR